MGLDGGHERPVRTKGPIRAGKDSLDLRTICYPLSVPAERRKCNQESSPQPLGMVDGTEGAEVAWTLPDSRYLAVLVM